MPQVTVREDEQEENERGRGELCLEEEQGDPSSDTPHSAQLG